MNNSTDFSQAVNMAARDEYFDRVSYINEHEGADVAAQVLRENMNNTDFVAMNDELREQYVSDAQLSQYRASNNANATTSVTATSTAASDIPSGGNASLPKDSNFIAGATIQQDNDKSVDFSQAVNMEAREEYFDRVSYISEHEGEEAAAQVLKENMNNTNFVELNEQLSTERVTDEQLAEYKESQNNSDNDTLDDETKQDKPENLEEGSTLESKSGLADIKSSDVFTTPFTFKLNNSNTGKKIGS